jgi:hypothetical protein
MEKIPAHLLNQTRGGTRYFQRYTVEAKMLPQETLMLLACCGTFTRARTPALKRDS